ncbi:fibronectin-binding protein [Streptococcus dysgalactiae subsp. equisimilis]|uniref:QVPTGV class sortase B protein-sorting domain-containing protein n=1 Tax=Streptococcus dysgalactiae TaxID=1334 RepID=UPI0010F2144E|nr:QVPTGV class sortase B protein-sorting domain-containing protein [Streptococcus dysgalactiae]VTT18432.1 fibronectin-binding protein [Streptococcus dysgalactiae subsp. equisimilis]
MKKCKAFLTSAMLVAAVAGGNTVRAADVNVKGSVVKITKSVNLINDKVLMPNTSFEFTVEPDNTAQEKKDNLEVRPGVKLTGKEFKVDYKNDDKHTTKDKTVEVDFADVEFDKPGIYRYSVAEVKGQTKGVTYDETKYQLDVYVFYDEGAGKNIAKYVVPSEKGSTEKKPIQFNNELKTTSLTVNKIVTGNAGDRNRDFDFTLELIPNAEFEKGKKVTFTKKGKDQTGTDVVATIGEETKFTLKNGESLTLDKLPIGISYKVKETNADDYKVSAELKEAGKTAVTYKLGEAKESDETADVIEVTNNKEGIIPTGVVNTIAPFAALAIVAIGGSLYFVKRKKA